MSNNPAPCSLLPTPYSQGDVATLLRFGIRYSILFEKWYYFIPLRDVD